MYTEKDKDLVFLKLKYPYLGEFSSWSHVPSSTIVNIVCESDNYDHLLDFRRLSTWDMADLLKCRIDFLPRCNKKLSSSTWECILLENIPHFDDIMKKSKLRICDLTIKSIHTIIKTNPEIYLGNRIQFSRTIASQAGFSIDDISNEILSDIFDDFMHILNDDNSTDGESFIGVSHVLTVVHMKDKDFFDKMFKKILPYMKGNSWYKLIKHFPEYSKRITDWVNISNSTMRLAIKSLDNKTLKSIPFNALSPEKQGLLLVDRPDLFLNNYDVLKDRDTTLYSDIIAYLPYLDKKIRSKSIVLIRNHLSFMKIKYARRIVECISQTLRFETDRNLIDVYIRLIPKMYITALDQDTILNIAKNHSSIIKIDFKIPHLK